jgi:hypothetical protein
MSSAAAKSAVLALARLIELVGHTSHNLAGPERQKFYRHSRHGMGIYVFLIRIAATFFVLFNNLPLCIV